MHGTIPKLFELEAATLGSLRLSGPCREIRSDTAALHFTVDLDAPAGVWYRGMFAWRCPECR